MGGMSAEFLLIATIFLVAMTLAVPLTQRLGLGSVLGYLIAGLVLAPVFLALHVDVVTLQHAAEFGVVVMLFLVGLELEPRTLWRMRAGILGLGGSQVVLTTGLIFGFLWLCFDWAWQTNLALSLALALSSTAIALQTLGERGEMGTPAGRRGFSVLLFQDIAVIPILALVPLLAIEAFHKATPGGGGHGGDSHGSTATLDLTAWTQWTPDWMEPIVILAAIIALLIAARYVMRPVLRYVARSHVREIFVGFSIFLVIGSALLMNALGLSAALGAFLAGVMLADSEYRHEIEADLDPIKGLLLGVFFMTVGAALDVGYTAANFPLVLGLVVGLVALKALVLWVLATIQRLPVGERLTFTVLLAQGGEFAFVLLLVYSGLGLVDPQQQTLITAVVSLSMLVTPLLLIVADRLIRPRLAAGAGGEGREMEVEDEGAPVIIAGFGRFGQITGRVLLSQGIRATVLDHDPDHIDFVNRFGSKVFYGDATRLDLLESAGAAKAKLLVIAIDDDKKSVILAQEAKRHFPNLTILARARNRGHVYELLAAGVDDFWRETFYSSTMMAGGALKALGMSEAKTNRILKKFIEHDRKTLREAAAFAGDEEALRAFAMRSREALESLMQSDLDEAEEEGKAKPKGTAQKGKAHADTPPKAAQNQADQNSPA